MPSRAIRHRYGGSGRGGFTHVPSGVAPLTARIQRRRLARPYSIGRRRPARQMSERSGALAPVPGRSCSSRFSLDVFIPSCRCRRVEDLHLPGATRALVTSLPGAGDRRAAGEQPRRGGHGATASATREPDRSGRAVLAVIARPPARSRRSVGRTEMGRVGPGLLPRDWRPVDLHHLGFPRHSLAIGDLGVPERLPLLGRLPGDVVGRAAGQAVLPRGLRAGRERGIRGRPELRRRYLARRYLARWRAPGRRRPPGEAGGCWTCRSPL